MEKKSAQQYTPKIEEEIMKGIELLAIEKIRDSAERAFVHKKTILESIKDYLLGPAVIGGIILSLGSLSVNWTFNSITERQRQIKSMETKKVEVLQKFQNSHRLRLLQSRMVSSALANGFPMDFIIERKRDYDKYYMDTNVLLFDTINFLEEIISNENLFIYDDDNSVFKKFMRKLTAITKIHDQCLTQSFAKRYEWEQILWQENTAATHSELKTKIKRDKEIQESFDKCTIEKSIYDFEYIHKIYAGCAESIFTQTEKAIKLEIKNNGGKAYKEWLSESNKKIDNSCKINE